ncbi:arsenate reductase (glutaredoxin) [Cytophaga hutchinsonii]|uniref:Arsenate reductase (Glutaredoxin) n=1 Tax=Cytophaga hutchinsonii (strain ATCC 33406 / DSM 1761 / CIP 103989 / NBRC 15051 / NCIMB 9469 / D465) TaxID=269798 RepID=A0A6N4SR67_CYTH3|nr:arsenate reductase (glutaredoxin) [Cytophaga hutchinsonii]ABG58858.1 arsenate reductase (glutaredoxin) [Cytophaga hutchinsonii ATCC 33406]SFX80768.1 arsenate reductase [Cytophaga hutchinsonii ATCC 33406]
MIKIYHNPRCQKSRTALAYVEERDENIEVVEYLKNPPTAKELKEVLQLLKMKPMDIIRKKETLYIDSYKDKEFTDAQWISILAEHPVLIERPILINKNKAVIARDEATLKSF